MALGACGPTAGENVGDGDGGPGGGADADVNCQGAACQNKCPVGTMTTVSGVVTMPNGIDPVPGALVMVPREVTEFPGEVRCEICDQISDVAITATQTDVDGSFTLGPIPTAEGQLPGVLTSLVAQKGRFRKLVQFAVNSPCENNAAQQGDFRLPGANSGYDNIPNIAVATGDYDIIECVLLKLGLQQGAFDLYNGVSGLGGPTPNTSGEFNTLLTDLPKMKTYNMIFINCTNNTYESLLSDPTIRGNLLDYVQSGGRLYVTDWSYDYIEQVEQWSPLIDFGPGTSSTAPEPMNAGAIGTGGITTEAQVLDDGMKRWLEAVEAASGDDIVSAAGRVHVEDFLASWVMQFMVPPMDNVKVWLTGQVQGAGLSGDLPLTTTFDYAQCGRVLYSSYHTAGRDIFGASDFPTYCSSESLSPQERVLEYLILHIADCISIE